jgi:5-methylcytosine-specific restriction enzyme A
MSQYPHLYNSQRWRGKRGLQRIKLLTDPLCWYCEQMGRVTAATVVDHIRPHKGDVELFYDWDNLRSTCAPCHNSAAAIKDRLGFAPGCGLDGLPLDGGHVWGKK